MRLIEAGLRREDARFDLFARRTSMSEGADNLSLDEGHRVASATRAGFPLGTVLRLLGDGYVLVRWDGNVLETAHHRDLLRVDRET